MKLRVVLLLGVCGVVGVGACKNHDPEISSHSGGMPGSGGSGASIGRTDPVQWCEVNAVLVCKCQRCHNDPRQNGAPFPLLTYDDTQALYGDAVQVWEAMKQAVETDFMPPNFFPNLMPKVERATLFERSTIVGWAEQGALDLGGTDCTAPTAEQCPLVVDGGGGEGGGD